MLMSVLIVSILFTFYLYLIFFSSLYQKKFISTCYEIRIIRHYSPMKTQYPFLITHMYRHKKNISYVPILFFTHFKYHGTE